ncbi:MAG: beta-propeller fold lactonase family protein [Acidobacteria bacterium]|nr:beta-propeller fold lactonase family protein [Acidobacteriota bacterium]
MKRTEHIRGKAGFAAILAMIAIAAAFVVSSQEIDPAGSAFGRKPTGQAQLVSIQPYPEMNGDMCQWAPASASSTLLAAFQQPRPGMPDEANRAEVEKRAPVRMIRDDYAAYSSVAVDPINDEVVLTDENLFQILVYDRLDNTPPTARLTEPKRIIAGLKTEIEFQCGLYIDPMSGDIYAVNNDTVDRLVIFSREAKGNVPPDRALHTPHGTFGIAVDEEAQEMFLTIQHDSAVVVYPKYAEEDDAPIRLLQGDRTMLADPHGIAVDTKNQLMFVSNYGAVSRRDPQQQNPELGRGRRGRAHWPLERSNAVPGSGQLLPPSISVYSLKASGDTPPLRVIQGPKTQMNWPAHIYLDPEREELYVANDMANSIIVFDSMADGDVAPKRVLQGPNTMIKNPTGVFVDLKNDELWVANFGNHAATVYKRDASGDTAPLRMIRSGPLGEQALGIGNPHPVAYDSKREEILVPN